MKTNEIRTPAHRVRGTYLELIFRIADKPEVAVSVGKSVSLKATKRNLIKRRLRQIAGKQIPRKPYFLIVRALPQAINATYENLETEFRKLFPKD